MTSIGPIVSPPAANIRSLAGAATLPTAVTGINAILAAMKTAGIMLPDPPTYSSIILGTAGLVAYWRLDEPSGTTATDQVAGHNGTYQGSPTLGATGLIANDTDTAVSFDGVNDQVMIADFAGASIATTGGLTLEAWIKPATVAAGSRCIISKSVGPYEWIFDQNADGLAVTVFDSGGSNLALSNTIGNFVISTIYHVAVTLLSSGTGRFYVNGVQVGTFAISAGSTDTASGLYIGVRGNGAASYSGTIDEVAIYSRELAASELLAHHAAGV